MLAPEEAQKFYDRFGAKQDKQAFYEDSATARMIAVVAALDASINQTHIEH